MQANRITLVGTLLLSLAIGSAAAKDESEPDPVVGFLAGSYRLIGQQPGSGDTYSGKMDLLYDEESGLRVVRRIGDEEVAGTAKLESSLGDRLPLLRMRFPMGGADYEGTYLWRSDLDNYPRLTGYIYAPDGSTESPGLEALFPMPPTPTQ